MSLFEKFNFSQDGQEGYITQRKWIEGVIWCLILGLIIFLCKESILAILRADILTKIIFGTFLAIVGLPGVFLLGQYKRGQFIKYLDVFRYEKGFFIPLKRINGNLGEIECLELATKKFGTSVHSILYIHLRYQHKSIILVDGLINSLDVLRLATIIGCAVKFSGNSKSIDLEKDEFYLEKDSVQAYYEKLQSKRLETMQ